MTSQTAPAPVTARPGASSGPGTRLVSAEANGHGQRDDPRTGHIAPDRPRWNHEAGPAAQLCPAAFGGSSELEALRPLELSEAVIDAALEAQSELARHAAGFHRVPHRDYLVAAIAAAHELGVLHYDADFDRIVEHSSLAFESVWIASTGTLDKEAADSLQPYRRAITHSLAQFSGARAREVLDNVLDLLEDELRADGLQAPAHR
jgi:hypothetical protein